MTDATQPDTLLEAIASSPSEAQCRALWTTYEPVWTPAHTDAVRSRLALLSGGAARRLRDTARRAACSLDPPEAFDEGVAVALFLAERLAAAERDRKLTAFAAGYGMGAA